MIAETEKLGGIGASEIGALFTREGVKSKTAQSLAYEKAVEIITGERRNLTTAAMQHGIFNEEEAFNYVVKPTMPTAKYQPSKSYKIAEGLWATPDVVDYENEAVVDIKCPYTIYSYLQYLKKLPSYYPAQIQMQLLATGYDKGYILVYLTSSNMDAWGNKIEYDIDINTRHQFIRIEADAGFHNEIIERADSFFFMRDSILIDLQDAIDVTDSELFDMAMMDRKVTRFKDKSNLMAWGGSIYRNEREGYLVIE